MKRLFKLIIAGFILLCTFILLSNLIVINSGRGRNFSSVEDLPFREVGVVLGTSKFLKNGGVNRYFQNRIDIAYDAYKEGKIRYILVSGDNKYRNYNEPYMMYKSLLEKGVKDEDIYLDYAGFRTLDSIVRSKEVFKCSSVTVISQKFHNQRAIFIGRNKGMDIVGLNAKDPNLLMVKVREIFAKTAAVVDLYILKTEPKFLGDPIVIGKDPSSITK